MAISLIDELRDPTTPQTLAALKALKNEIVGHHHRKEIWIRKGIIPCLKRILDTQDFGSAHRLRSDTDDESARHTLEAGQEQARLQAITIIGSLAHGGPSFIKPLRRGHLWQPLIHVISPRESSPAVVLATLRCLIAIVDAAVLEDVDEQTELEEFLKQLWTEQSLANLNLILSQYGPNSSVIQQQIALTAELIAKTCNTERRRKHIKISGIFGSLAHLLATFVVASGHTELRGSAAGNSGIPPASPKAKLTPILQAICAVIADSKLRVSEFCCNSVWGQIFPVHARDVYAFRAPVSGPARTGTESSLNMLSGTNDLTKSKSNDGHPASSLWTGKGSHDKPHLESDDEVPEGFNARDDDDTPLVSWLIDVVRYRDGDGLTRLMAIWLLGLFFRSHMISMRRQHSLSMFLVPVLVQMLDGQPSNSDTKTAQAIKEMAPKVLALFVQDNDFLQKGAVEGGVVKKLSQLLKESFNPIPPSLITPMWRAHDSEEHTLDMDPSLQHVPGKQGIPLAVHHIVKWREALLLGISGMATISNANRQAIIDNGVVPFVIESLKPREQHDHQRTSLDITKPVNSIAILIAACAVATTLSRSIAALRTSLVDAGLAKPVYGLLQHPHPAVQMAATETVTNMILPFSAMRQDITDAGVLEILCKRAHSSDSKLRRSALWALSHFVVEAPNDLKIKVVRELNANWIKHVICNESGLDSTSRHGYDGGGYSMTAANSSGERIDILNSIEDRSHEYQLHKEAGTDMELTLEYAGSTPIRSSEGLATASDEYFDAGADERTFAIQAARDDLAVQEQGLNLLRNLLVGGPDISEIVDFLFAELGQDKLFDMFTDLLKPKNMDRFRGQDNRPGASAPKLVPPPTEIVIGVCYTLVHIAASHPQHKEIVLAQTELLKLILPLFTHPNAAVRTALVWFVINVSWKEDANDKDAAISRALELKNLGILTKVQEAVTDSNLDVRERAKHAISTLTDLMRELYD